MIKSLKYMFAVRSPSGKNSQNQCRPVTNGKRTVLGHRLINGQCLFGHRQAPGRRQSGCRTETVWLPDDFEINVFIKKKKKKKNPDGP